MRHKGSDGGGDGGTVALWQLCVDSTVVLLVSGENRNDDCLLLIEVYNSLLLILSGPMRPGAIKPVQPSHLHISQTQ